MKTLYKAEQVHVQVSNDVEIGDEIAVSSKLLTLAFEGIDITCERLKEPLELLVDLRAKVEVMIEQLEAKHKK